MTVFVPGPLRNPMNDSHGHWATHARWARDWRARTMEHVLLARIRLQGAADLRPLFYAPATPKRILLTAHTVKRWDEDNLRAGLKPVVDGLRDAQIISDDGPDSGHVIEYRQVVAPTKRGVLLELGVR